MCSQGEASAPVKLSEAWPLFIQDFVHLYGRSETTVPSYGSAKNSFVSKVGDVEVSEINGTILSRWSRQMQANKTMPGTINRYLDAMASFGKWAKKRGLTEEDFFDGVKRVEPEAPVPKALRWTEALAMADNCYGLRFSPRDRLFILFLLYTGARADEACHFPLHNLDLTERKAVFTNTKGKIARVVYFGEKLKMELELYLVFRAGTWPNSYWLFPTRSGDRMSVEDAQAIPHRYQLGITLHQLRHTFITHALKQTKNLALVQSLAGHKSILTTARYLRIWDDEKQDAAVAIEGDETQTVNKRGKRLA